MEIEPILHVWINNDNDLIDLTITEKVPAHHGTASPTGYTTSEVSQTNEKHPFFTEEHGFTPVASISIGMRIL